MTSQITSWNMVKYREILSSAQAKTAISLEAAEDYKRLGKEDKT